MISFWSSETFFLMFSNIEHLPMGLVAIFLSLQNCYSVFYTFSVRVFGFFFFQYWGVWVFNILSVLNPYQTSVANAFSHSVGLFVLLMDSFAILNLLSLVMSHVFCLLSFSLSDEINAIKGTIKEYCYCCSVAQLCPTPCNPMDYSMPGFPVLHHLPELAQTPVHWIGDAIQPSHPLLSPLPTFNLSQ